MKKIAENKGFEVYFNCAEQKYSVFKDGVFLIGDKYQYSDVKAYLD